ncbi:AtpZ/AtpI family protein [Arachidicoccus soli]|uniref:AtpZ/AtpI family protein n=1 Tax=Arachidicoccus soli TaxID=2341117 RepID=A0A386HNM5_9BACT|nr:AtpZ/AtpI family protein [Arachidicoccus soli]AYD46934.1 AtpZ/AtpI family protein [Arachidicoccus soli]
MNRPMKNGNSNNYMRYIGLGIQLMSGVGLAIWLGYWIDEKVKWKLPIFIWVLPLIILVFMLVKLVEEFSKKSKK